MNLILQRSTLAEIYQGMAKILAKSPYGLQIISSPGHIEARVTLQQQTLIYKNYAPENDAGEGTLTLNSESLKSINAHRGGEGWITFTSQEDNLIDTDWQTGRLHSSLQFPNIDSFPEITLSEEAEFTPFNTERFRDYFNTCTQVISTEMARYRIDCICLDGDKNQMLATDGRQIFIGNGIAFPWQGKCLLPVGPTLPDRVLFNGATLSVAKSANELLFRNGPWTYQIQTPEPNFPDPQAILPHHGDTDLLIQLHEEDAKRIEELLPLMPGGESPTRYVTLDAAEELLLHAEHHGAEATLPLKSTLWMGDPIHVSFNRDYLLRAIRLGHRELRFQAGTKPVLTRSKDTLYLFMPVTIREEEEISGNEPGCDNSDEETPDEDEESDAQDEETSDELEDDPDPWPKRAAWLEREFTWRMIDDAVDLGVMDPSESESECEDRLKEIQQLQKDLHQARKEAHTCTSDQRLPLQPPACKMKWSSVGQFSTTDGHRLELLRSKDGFFSVKNRETINITREHISSLLGPLLVNQWTPFTLALYYNGHTWWVDGEHILERKGKTAKRHLTLTEYRPAHPKHLHWEMEILSHFLNTHEERLPVSVRLKAQARLDQFDSWAHSESPQTLDLLSLCLQFAKTA